MTPDQGASLQLGMCSMQCAKGTIQVADHAAVRSHRGARQGCYSRASSDSPTGQQNTVLLTCSARSRAGFISVLTDDVVVSAHPFCAAEGSVCVASVQLPQRGRAEGMAVSQPTCALPALSVVPS
eukprot:271754-Chlamydomonas_euryale.AAC.10